MRASQVYPDPPRAFTPRRPHDVYHPCQVNVLAPNRAAERPVESSSWIMTTTDRITPRAFQEAEGLEDWRVLGEGACVHFRTGSFAESAALVAALAVGPPPRSRKPRPERHSHNG